MRCSPFLIAVIAAALAAPALAGDTIVYEDDFTDLGEWAFWSSTLPGEPYTYVGTADPSLGVPAPAAHIQGDWDTDDTDGPVGQGRAFGLQRTYPSLLRFHLTFDWRAWSSNITTTRARLEIVQASDETVLYSQQLIAGSILDTGWLTYPPTDLSFALPTDPTDVRVRLSLSDGWHADHDQHMAFDNVQLITTELPPVPDVPFDVDDFSATTDPWTHWRDTDAFSPTYSLEHDLDEGDPAPSARVMGSYAYSGSTRRYGLERTLPVTLPFVVEFDYATLDAASVTFQLLQPDGTRGHTLAMPVPDEAWQHHAAVDLTGNVDDLTEVVARLWIVGTDHGNPDNALWVDDFSWTSPCDETALFFADEDGDGFGDPDAPHPDGDTVYCYPPSGYTDDTSDCDDLDDAAFPGAEEDCDTAQDEDCDGSEVDGLDADCPPPVDDDDSADDDDDDDDDDIADDDDSADDTPRSGDSPPTGRGCGCVVDSGGGVGLAVLLVLGVVRRRGARSG